MKSVSTAGMGWCPPPRRNSRSCMTCPGVFPRVSGKTKLAYNTVPSKTTANGTKEKGPKYLSMYGKSIPTQKLENQLQDMLMDWTRPENSGSIISDAKKNGMHPKPSSKKHIYSMTPTTVIIPGRLPSSAMVSRMQQRNIPPVDKERSVLRPKRSIKSTAPTVAMALTVKAIIVPVCGLAMTPLKSAVE